MIVNSLDFSMDPKWLQMQLKDKRKHLSVCSMVPPVLEFALCCKSLLLARALLLIVVLALRRSASMSFKMTIGQHSFLTSLFFPLLLSLHLPTLPVPNPVFAGLYPVEELHHQG